VPIATSSAPPSTKSSRSSRAGRKGARRNADLGSSARAILVIVALATALVGATGCATTVATGPFPAVQRIETELKRGASTKLDVRRVLGPPNGTGSAILPTDPRPREVWFYFDSQAKKLKLSGAGGAEIQLRQQILLVFFERGVFDGFMWYSSESRPEVR
jgi:hypothetical protein